jgi:ribosome-associated protein
MHVKPVISSEDRAVTSAALALDKKAFNVRILDIRKVSTIADYLVLATGTSDKQVIAIADSVRTGLKKFGKVLDIEGAREGKWVVIDYGDVIVHVFLEEMRSYYNLDELWSNAAEVAVPEEYQWEHRQP